VSAMPWPSTDDEGVKMGVMKDEDDGVVII
jgi:hypothetical protein